MPLTIAGMTVPMVDIVASVEPIKVAGQADPQLVKVGFGLLRQFGVTWNYRLQTMSFYTP